MSMSWTRFTLSLSLLLAVPLVWADPPTSPATNNDANKPVSPGTSEPALPDFSNWHPLHKAAYLSAHRAAGWLWQANRPDGLFQSGFNPAMNLPLEDDQYLNQAIATLALARASSVMQNPSYAARAKQAMLALLSQTKTDPADPTVRWTMMPHANVNRLASASLLVQTIAELPAPGADLIEQAEQLANFLRQSQNADGSFQVNDASPPALAYHGWALQAIMQSQAIKPANWKLDAARKAATFYRSWFAGQKQAAPLPGLIAGFTLAYQQTKEKPFAETALEMADFLLKLQYPPTFQPLLWQGGFATLRDGQAVLDCPTVLDAAFLEGLVYATQLCQEAGDLTRHERCKQCLDRGITFLMTLQFTQANTSHFADWYRPKILGAFQHSPQNGLVNMPNTPMATRTLLAYVQLNKPKG